MAAFRDALLEQYPAILDQLLQKAVENEDAKVRRQKSIFVAPLIIAVPFDVYGAAFISSAS